MKEPDCQDVMYDKSTVRVIVWACFTIVLAVALTGGIGYFITQQAVVDKLKTRDLIYIIQSIAAKVDGRMERAEEAAVTLAQDPAIREWLAGKEQDEHTGSLAKDRMNAVGKEYDYANSFIVSAITGHYWAEGPKLLEVMAPDKPSDRWFYQALAEKKRVALNIDYNTAREETFVFVNALIGSEENPQGIAGVGLSLHELSQEFQNYKIGERSHLWLVDKAGRIHLSDDIKQNGHELQEYLDAAVASRILGAEAGPGKPAIIEYNDDRGETMDLVYQQIQSADWKLVFQIPRQESIAILGSIKFNATVASILSLILIIFIFYLISRRIANPFKRAVLLAQEMERQVAVRTQEVAEKNREIMDSIAYAQRLQQAMLPGPEELGRMVKEHFVIWRPRDVVGGDSYWSKMLDPERSLIAIIDCTGHSVPGALMTMAVHSILDNIADGGHSTSPAAILAALNRQMKETLHRSNRDGVADDGADIGFCYIERGKRLVFAGAKISLYVKRANQVQVLKGDAHSLGYRRSQNEWTFTEYNWPVEEGDVFYLTTDGYVHQNGGENDYPFGRKRLQQALLQADRPVAEQDAFFLELLQEYMGKEEQRDDITFIGFSLK